MRQHIKFQVEYNRIFQRPEKKLWDLSIIPKYADEDPSTALENC